MLNKQEKERLQAKLEQALAAILDHLGTNTVVKTNFGHCLKTRLSITPDGAALEYDYHDKAEGHMNASAKYLSQQTGLPGKTFDQVHGLLDDYIGHIGGTLLEDYIEEKRRKNSGFSIEKHVFEHPKTEDDFFVALQAKNLGGLIDGMNEMLHDLGLSSYTIKHPSQDKGQGGGPARA